MKSKHIFWFILAASLLLGACSQIPKQDKDLTYTIENYGEKVFLKTSTSADCINFEANYEAGACDKYTYEYNKEGQNLKIILTNLDKCEYHQAYYGLKGKICNLEKGQYNLIFGTESKEDSIFHKSVEIK